MLTIPQAKERLQKAGLSHADVARELKVPRQLVTAVLAGKFKCLRGDAHKVAVALGLKDGVILPEGTSLGEALRLVSAEQSASAAPSRQSPSVKSARIAARSAEMAK